MRKQLAVIGAAISSADLISSRAKAAFAAPNRYSTAVSYIFDVYKFRH